MHSSSVFCLPFVHLPHVCTRTHTQRAELLNKDALLREMDHQCSLAVGTISEIRAQEKDTLDRFATVENELRLSRKELEQTKITLELEQQRSREMAALVSSVERVTATQSAFWRDSQIRVEEKVKEIVQTGVRAADREAELERLRAATTEQQRLLRTSIDEVGERDKKIAVLLCFTLERVDTETLDTGIRSHA